MVYKKIKNLNSLFKILLSAILFNLSFFFTDYFGWVIILSFVFLYLQFTSSSQLSCAYRGLIWGITTYSFHFIWLYELFLTKSGATFWLATAIYLFVIFYCTLITIFYFLAVYLSFCFIKRFSHFIKIPIFTFWTYLYFLFIQKYSLWFLGTLEGYPFINPAIPLAKYKWFLFLYQFICCGFAPSLQLWRTGVPLQELWSTESHSQTKVFFIKPLNQFKEKLTPCRVGQHIYHQLANLNLHKYEKKYKNILIFAPESSYPFALNEHLEQINFWDNVLPPNAYFLIGSQRSEGDKLYQTVYCITKCRIINFYDKSHRVQFVEKIPKGFTNYSWASSLFLHDKQKFNKGKNNVNQIKFKISDELELSPQICSEFFYEKDFDCGQNLICLFINDSWFMLYFRNIMKNLALLKLNKTKKILIYVGH